ncbi:hypothetical protein KQH60_00605 [Mycetohabitans sp. B8]|uniref:hypothetical protein n=1 Tax=Mycetohabitans sp. B8 TaxID=2841845 RepID=UPI001F365D83|nr:hypothetical protein [Mycetohabitans sp. B8]MCG1041144.1 hypothetical protein [Mycetohabitans sp. B8]
MSQRLLARSSWRAGIELMRRGHPATQQRSNAATQERLLPKDLRILTDTRRLA